MDKNEITELTKQISELKEAERKNLSFKRSFVKGVITGFGGVIGGVVLIALLIAFLSLFHTAPIVGDYISNIIEAIKRK